METSTLLDRVDRDGRWLTAIGADRLDVPVPSCPAWNVGQLLGHLGWVYRWVAATLLADPADPPHPRTIERAPAGAEVVGWFAGALQDVLDALDHTEPDRVYSTFIGPQPARWWIRRMAHETTIHRWDAQNALGPTDPIDPALAVDGIDEALDTYVVRRFDLAAFGAEGETLHLHATDTEGEWMLTMAPVGLTWSHGHGKGDAAVRGRAEDLLLFLMGRRSADGLEVFGDTALPGRWQAAATF
jgi:uncharacterized protein (TIGR03083 family)